MPATPAGPSVSGMRIDLIGIFPAYFDALRLSLLGRAIERGALEIGVHDLRRWTDDVHRSVDDTPYGGGPGMLMRPEPWGRALDEVTGRAWDTPGSPSYADARTDDASLLIVPTPSGRRFTQRDAREWAQRSRLIIACGRYEGIDARVTADAARRMDVAEVSIGDYILAGGEAAALVIVEAVARLLPGFMGNVASTTDESFEGDGGLEAPAFTRPARWRDLEVPEVLLSGDHAAIAAWRRAHAEARTVEHRPDLLAP